MPVTDQSNALIRIDSMRRNIFIIGLMAALALSCGRKVDFQYRSFVSFDSASYVFDEDAGEIRIPVVLYNPTGEEVFVTFETIDGKAVEGVDYEVVSPVSGVLALGGGVNSVDIVLAIRPDHPALTGSKDFQLSLSSATEGCPIGGTDVTKIKIKDLDHPLKRFIGEWTADATGYSGGRYSWTITIEGDDADPTYKTLLIYDLEPAAVSMYGLSSSLDCNIFEAKYSDETQHLTIAENHFLGIYSVSDTESLDFTLCGTNGKTLETATNLDDVVLVMSPDERKLTIPYAWGLYGPAEEGYTFHEVYDGGVEFVKK